VAELVAALDELPHPVRLVLDDLHEIDGRGPLGDLARLVGRRPSRLRLVLASSADPPLALARLRAEGRLHELRADRLRFTAPEATALLRETAPGLTPEQIAALHERTEGWPAGLRLAAIALRRFTHTDRFVAAFSGDERSAADYLTTEVLAGLPTTTLELLRAVSVCAQSPVGLAIALSGRDDAAQALDAFTRDTGLVERTTPGVYRLHALLRTYLVAGLARQHARRHRGVHGVAARWWG